VLQFEKDVINLLRANNIDHNFHPESHLLVSDILNIKFIPIDKDNEDQGHYQSLTKETKLIIHLWEDIYWSHGGVVNSRVLSLFGISKRIHGRSTIIKSISQLELDDFLKVNHLNIITKAKYKYGMYHKEELVAVAAFGRSCPIQSNGRTYRSHELIRFCSLLNHTVVGGLSKLIHHFEGTVNPEHIMTYVDREWSEGSSYKKLGFSIDCYTQPQIFWLSPEGTRYYEGEILKTKTVKQLKEVGWKDIKNLGNIKLVKFI
jgi:hypothetical protein